ncbi:MAG: DUF721 domain-containing protein [Candidatus Aphodosoma sp.]
MRYNKTLSIGEILATELHKAIGKDTMNGLEAIKVIETWRELLGPVLSRYTSEERFANGRLTVRITSSVLRNDLFLQRTILLERLNKMLTGPKVKSLELM